MYKRDEEKRIKRGKELLGWKIERKDFLEKIRNREIDVKEIERERGEGGGLWERIKGFERDLQKRERRNKECKI